MGKSIRFAELVKKAGRPEAATLWQDPERDPEIKTAIRQNRILTVRQEAVGSKKDFGEIGFKKDRNVSYFIFPEPLPKGDDARVIGINYDLVEQKLEPPSKTTKSVSPPRTKTKKPLPPPKPAPPVKTEKEFFVVVRKTAVWETTVKVEAMSKTEAAEQAEKRVKEQALPLSDAIVEVKSREVKGC